MDGHANSLVWFSDRITRANMVRSMEEHKLRKVSSAVALGGVTGYCLTSQEKTRDCLNQIAAYATYSSNNMNATENELSRKQLDKLLLDCANLFDMDIIRELRHYFRALLIVLTTQYIWNHFLIPIHLSVACDACAWLFHFEHADWLCSVDFWIIRIEHADWVEELWVRRRSFVTCTLGYSSVSQGQLSAPLSASTCPWVSTGLLWWWSA